MLCCSEVYYTCLHMLPVQQRSRSITQSTAPIPVRFSPDPLLKLPPITQLVATSKCFSSQTQRISRMTRPACKFPQKQLKTLVRLSPTYRAAMTASIAAMTPPKDPTTVAAPPVNGTMVLEGIMPPVPTGPDALAATAAEDEGTA